MCSWYNRMQIINTSFQNVVETVDKISAGCLEKLKRIEIFKVAQK